MSEYRNVRIAESLWAKLKQQALDERVTLREVLERACFQYIERYPFQTTYPIQSKTPVVATPPTVTKTVRGTGGPSELTYEDER